MSNYVGIDCGLDGAWAYQHRGGWLRRVMPVIAAAKGRELVLAEVKDYMQYVSDHYPAAIFVIENPGPHAGSASGLRSMTHCYTAVLMAAVTLGLDYRIITPRKWQSHFWRKKDWDTEVDGPYDTKKAATNVVKQRFPEANLMRNSRCRTPHDGIVDAILIAQYGKEVGL